MKYAKILLLFAALQQLSVESRTWRSHTFTSVQPSFRPRQHSSFLPLRGGEQSQEGVPVVPEDVIQNSDMQQSVSRGGSVKTEKYPGGITVTKPVAASSPGSVAPSETAVENVTAAVTTELEEPGSSPKKHKKEKKRKKHKQIAKKLKNRNATNFRRKILHAMFGFFFAGLNHFIPRARFVPFMTFLTSSTLLVELLRYRKGFGWINDTMHFVLGSSLRKHEMDGKFTGSFYYFLGVTVTAALYPKNCATLAICQLAIADPTASYFGRATRHVYWSRIENGLGGFGRNKGILGFIGGALACVPMNYRFLSLAKFSHTVKKQTLLFASVALGFAGAFADLAVPTPTLTLPKRVCGVRVPPFHVDDNFVVPIFSGYACTKMFEALKWSTDTELGKYLLF